MPLKMVTTMLPTLHPDGRVTVQYHQTLVYADDEALLPESDEICASCNGSGEGMYDGTRCHSCGGSGVEREGYEEDDRRDYEREDKE